MTVPSLALLAVSALVGAGTTTIGTQAPVTLGGVGRFQVAHLDADDLGSRYDAAYAVFAVGDPPLAAGPSAFSTSIRIRADTGAARSTDGGLAVGASQVTAGSGQATAVVHDVIALKGLVRAASITARCRNGVVTSRVFGGTVGHLQGRASVAFDVRSKKRDGSTTVIGLPIRLHTGRGTVINIASATFTPAANSNSRIRPAPVDRSTSFGADTRYVASLLPTHPRTVQTDNAPVGR